MVARIVQIHYQDHHSQNAAPEDAAEQSTCLNMVYGEVVYEDDEWVKVCHEKTDIDGSTEQWCVTAIRQADVTGVKLLA